MIEGKKVVATVEGRMTSSRLPGKIMMPLAGKPVMQHMIERHRRSKLTDEVVVATTINAADDPVVELANSLHCSVYRGSEDDVMSRIVEAGKMYEAEILIQGMSDSPMVDWRLLDKAVELLVTGDYDCAGNEFPETYPIGFDVRAYNFKTLVSTNDTYADHMYREHAGYSIRGNPDKFKIGNFEAEGGLRWPELRLTLDTKEDYALISAVYEALYEKNPDFSAEEVIALLKTRPDLVALNSEIHQKSATE